MARAIVNTYEFDKALRMVVPFCSTDNNRPNLQGVFFEAYVTNRLRMTGADGFRLGSVEIDAEVDNDFAALIDTKYLPMLDTKKRRYTAMDMVLDGKFSMNGMKFPDYEQLFPTGGETILLPDDLLEYVEILQKMTKGYSAALRWSITSGGHVMDVHVDSMDLSRNFLFEIETKEPLKCDPVVLAVNINFLVDILRAGYGMPLKLHITRVPQKFHNVLASKPTIDQARLVMVTGENARWVAMPMYFNEYDIRYPGGKNANPRN